MTRRPILLLCLYLGWLYAAWTAWAFVLARNPNLDGSGVMRAAVRLVIWLLPLFILRVVGPTPPLFELRLRHDLRRGIAIGLVGFTVLLMLAAAQYRTSILHLRLPRDLPIWLNPIITAPLAEEIVFRGVVFGMLRNHSGVKFALLASALLFALIHLPYWCMAGGRSPGALLIQLCIMAAYGLFFAGLFLWSGSLWSPLICHWLNNLLTLSIPVGFSRS